MSKANFTILKQCEHCGNMFEAQKRTTRFCSHRCNQRSYKARKRMQTKRQVERQAFEKQKAKPKVTSLSMELIKGKEYLSVTEVAVLFGCSKHTVYRMIKHDELRAANLYKKLTRIRRIDIEKIFEEPREEKPEKLTIRDCYTSDQIVKKYGVAKDTIYGFGRKYKIQKLKDGGITYYSKADINNLFKV